MQADAAPASRLDPQLHPRIAVTELMAVPLAKASAITGLSRATIYRLAGSGSLRLLKAGRTTLVCGDSLRAYIASLPQAQIRAPKQKAVA